MPTDLPEAALPSRACPPILPTAPADTDAQPGILTDLHAAVEPGVVDLSASADEFGLLTLADAAALLHCSKAHIGKAVAGRVIGCPAIPSVSLGRRKLIRRTTLLQWVEDNERFAAGATIPTSPVRGAGERA